VGRKINPKRGQQAGLPSPWIIIAGGIIVLAAVVAYHNCFVVPFVFDDIQSITQNPTTRHLWPIWQALSPPHEKGFTVAGRPLLNLSLAINYSLGGDSPWGYHVANLAIHILAGLTLFGILRRTFLRPGPRERFGASAVPWSLAIAVLWVVHPLQTESVTYVVQRAESLMGLFYLATFYFFIRGAESTRPGSWFVCCFVACLLGMATKEVMVSAPFMILLYDRTFIAVNFAEAWRRRWRFYVALAGTWVMLAWLLIGTTGRGGTAGFGTVMSWWLYALTQCWAIGHYLWLSVWPQRLVFDYGILVFRDPSEVLPYILLLAGLLAGTLVALVYSPRLGFLGAWFLVILAPSSSVVPVASEPIAEHRMYLPLAAVIVVILTAGSLLCRYVCTRFRWPERIRVCLQIGAVTGATFALILATIQRNAQYHSAESIWADVVDKRPEDPRGHANLGLALLDDGRSQESIPHFATSLGIDPNEPIVRCNLAIALARSGATNQSLAELQETLREAPYFALAHVSLADILASQGDRHAALEQYTVGIALNPNDQAAHFNLAQLFVQLGQREQAVKQYREVVHLDPRDATAHYNLANLLAESGRDAEAIPHYIAAARFDPHNARSQINLGNLFLKQERPDNAIAAYTDALRVDPNAFNAHNNLAVLLAGRGDLPRAAEHFREAVRLKPDVPEVHSALAEVLDRQGLHEEAQRELAEAQKLRETSGAH
jgi:tetratricopeptide (TPR) repeat protein